MDIVLLVGNFKPPTASDYRRLRYLVKSTDVDKAIILIGAGKNSLISQDGSEEIWEIYKKHFKIDIDIVKLNNPGKGEYLLNWLEENGDQFDTIYSDQLAGENVKTIKLPNQVIQKTVQVGHLIQLIQNKDYNSLKEILLPDQLTETEEDEILAILGIQELKETHNLVEDYEKVLDSLKQGNLQEVKKQLAHIREMMGYPSAKEYKAYMKKLKDVRSFLNKDFQGKWKEVPDSIKTPVKKLYNESKIEFELDDDRVRAKEYIISVLRKIFPEDFEFFVDKKHSKIVINVPRKKRKKKSEEEEKRKGEDGEEDPESSSKFEAVKGLHWSTPQEAIRSIEKLKNSNIPTNWKIRSLLPIVNRAEGVIKGAKDIGKKRNLTNAFKKIEKYYRALRSGREN